ncbi:MAG: hypothetical protein ACLU4N_26840, partial [Butyricimonas faecihominis]
EKWHRAALAADEAIEACRNAGKMLIDNSKATSVLQTHMLNIEKSVRAANFSSTEALLMIRRASDSGSEWWYWALPRLISDPIGGIPGTQLAPSMKMVEMFYTENGLPLGEDRAYSGNIYGMTQEKDPKYSEVVALNEDFWCYIPNANLVSMLVLEPIVAIGGLADLQAVILRWRPSKERNSG